MAKKLWRKAALLTLAAGSTLLSNYACLDTTVQRIVVAVAFD